MQTKFGDYIDPVDKAIEECAEIIHILSKIKRFGIHDVHPDTGESNIRTFYTELEDFEEAIEAIKEEYNI